MRSIRRRVVTDHSILPLFHTSNIITSCYRDFKIVKFNASIFRIGRRYERFLRPWFSVGIGFSLSLLILIAVVTVLELASCLHLYEGEMRLTNIFSILTFGFPSMQSGFIMPICDVLCFFISTVVSVSVHELGHALSAASEGIPVDHIAIFIAFIFPGALVALNNELLLTLPRVSTLRVYSAGIWHNAVLCAACGSALLLLPLILHPFYVHGENSLVLDVSSSSPLSVHVSAGDIITSLDDIPIHEPDQWLKVLMKLNWQARQGTSVHVKRICVPHSLVEGKVFHMEGTRVLCKNDSFAFSVVNYLDSNTSHQDAGNETIGVCLSFIDVVNFNKYQSGRITTTSVESSCLCPRGDYCISPILLSGLNWVKVSYFRSSILKCSKQRILQFPNWDKYDFGEIKCHETFVFVGNMKTLAHSVKLTFYEPRWLSYSAAFFPYFLQIIIESLYHLSLALVIVNILPVYFMDGEAILEVIVEYLTLVGVRKRAKLFGACLLVTTLVSSLTLFKILISQIWYLDSS